MAEVSKAREPERRCACGVVLSTSNRGTNCSVCVRLATEVSVTEDTGAEERLAARKVAGVYAQPGAYEDPGKYLAALTVALDELTVLVGPTPPDLTEIAATRVPDPAATYRPRSLARRTRPKRQSIKKIDEGEDAAVELLSTIHDILDAEVLAALRKS